jgi:hypothetical protein
MTFVQNDVPESTTGEKAAEYVCQEVVTPFVGEKDDVPSNVPTQLNPRTRQADKVS